MDKINIETSLKTAETSIDFKMIGKLDNNVISYEEDGVSVTIYIYPNKLELVRLNSEYEIRLMLEKGNSYGTYKIKELGILDLNVVVNNLQVSNNEIQVEYVLTLQGNNMGIFNYKLNYEVIK